MKKVMEWVVFAAIVAILPGGALLGAKKIVQRVKTKFLVQLMATVMMVSGCAWTQNGRVSGFVNPSEHVIAEAIGEDISTNAYVKRKCADSPANCRAMELFVAPWAYGAMMDTPAGYTWAGVRAVGAGSPTAENGDVRKDIADIKKHVNAIGKGQDAFFQALKDRKKGQR